MKAFLTFLLMVLTIPDANAYKRSDYKIWSDFNKNCFNTRHDILIERAISVTLIKDCKILDGKWIDSYDGKELTNLQLIDIDHVIPLYYADKHGLANDLKPVFGNDIDNLLITSAKHNRTKGSKGIYQWHPEHPYLCKYAKIWQDIGYKYNLTFDKDDDVFIFKTLLECAESVNNSLHK